jgi:hypothetical protein
LTPTAPLSPRRPLTPSDAAIIEQSAKLLASALRIPFLLALSSELTIAARYSYVQAGLTPDASQQALRCVNELQIVVLKQLAAAVLGRRAAYPDQSFLTVLEETAALGLCDERLRDSLRLAIDTVQA